MTKIVLKYLCCLVVVFQALVLPARYLEADSLDDFYIQQVLDRYYTTSTDVKALSLARSSVPVCDGAACVSNNPAGLAWMRENQLYADVGASSLKGYDQTNGQPASQDTTLGNGMLGIPLGDTQVGAPSYGTLGVGYARYQGSTDDLVGTIPDGHRRTVGYGYAISPSIALGYSLTFYDDQLNTRQADHHSHARFLHIFGLQHRASDDFEWGATFQLGVGQADAEDYIVGSDGLARPREYFFQLGGRYDTSLGDWYLTGRFRHVEAESNFEEVSEGVFTGGEEEGSEGEVSLGLELEPIGFLTPRFGVRYRYVDYTFHRENIRDLSGSINELAGSIGASIALPAFWTSLEAPRIDIGADFGDFARGWIEGRGAFIVSF